MEFYFQVDTDFHSLKTHDMTQHLSFKLTLVRIMSKLGMQLAGIHVH